MLGNKGSKQFYRVGGTRGGQDQFKWDDVKADKYRENYLGNSVQAPVGRWQKGRDLTWYAKNNTEQAQSLAEERRRLQDLDDDLMNAALGITAEKKWTTSTKLDADDLKHLLARGAVERPEEVAERVQGLGAAPMKFHDHIERASYLEKEIRKMKHGDEEAAEQVQVKSKGRVIVPESSSGTAEEAQGSGHRDQQEEEHGSDGHRHKKHRKEDKKERKASKSERSSHKHRKHSHRDSHHRDRDGDSRHSAGPTTI